MVCLCFEPLSLHRRWARPFDGKEKSLKREAAEASTADNCGSIYQERQQGDRTRLERDTRVYLSNTHPGTGIPAMSEDLQIVHITEHIKRMSAIDKLQTALHADEIERVSR
jgi:hypothetical protein